MNRTAALDPMATMAFNVASSPRTYALLVGSGVSRAADIPTGWEIVTDLVVRYATGLDPDVDQAAVRADPESWWAANGAGTLGYSSTLEQLADTPAARSGVIRPFIEPGDASHDHDDTWRRPTAAHHAIARLAAGGWIDVIVTTNFDRLIEQALQEVGIHPQVLSTADHVASMQPLNHDGVTVIKVHGDYVSPHTLNTADELAAYPDPLDKLLAEIFARYGLIVSGWSGDWDTALVDAIRRTPSRRYPLYWGERSAKGDTATRLVADRAGIRVPVADANEMFHELAERVEAIAQMGTPPVTVDVAITRLKRYLPNPSRRIDLVDLVDQTTRDFVEAMLDHRDLSPQPQQDPATWSDLLARYRDVAIPLVRLLAHGVHHDHNHHTTLWTRTIERMMAVDRPEGTHQDRRAVRMMRYPALMALHTTTTLALLDGREDQFLDLCLNPVHRDQFDNRADRPAVAALNRWDVVDLTALANQIIQHRRQNDTKYYWPVLELLNDDLADVLAEFVHPTETRRLWAAAAARDYRIALLQQDLQDASGLSIMDHNVTDGHFNLHHEFKDAAERFNVANADPDVERQWVTRLRSDDLSQLQDSLHQTLPKYQRW